MSGRRGRFPSTETHEHDPEKVPTFRIRSRGKNKRLKRRSDSIRTNSALEHFVFKWKRWWDSNPPLPCRASPPQGGRLRLYRCLAPVANVAERARSVASANLPPCRGDARQGRGGLPRDSVKTQFTLERLDRRAQAMGTVSNIAARSSVEAWIPVTSTGMTDCFDAADNLQPHSTHNGFHWSASIPTSVIPVLVTGIHASTDPSLQRRKRFQELPLKQEPLWPIKERNGR